MNTSPAATLGFASFAALTSYVMRRRAAAHAKRFYARGAPRAAIKPHNVPFGKVAGENRGPKPMQPAVVRNDDYFWLRDDDRKDAAVLAHLRAENAYCHAQLGAPTASLRKALYAEMLSHVKETDEAVPYPHGDYLYYTKTIKGLSYKLHCRRRRAPSGADAEDAADQQPPQPEEVILDENEVARALKHCDVAAVTPSPDHALLAFAVDTTGRETYEIRVKDLATGGMLGDKLVGEVDGDVEWAADGKSVFYITMDDAHRPHKLWRHVLGTPQADDACLLTEDDERFWMYMYKSRSGRFLFSVVGSKITTEVRYVDFEAEGGAASEMTCFHPREHDMKYHVSHLDDAFLVRTNADGAKNFKVVATPVGATGRAHWRDVLPYDEAVNVKGVSCFARHVVVSGREGGNTRLWVMDLPPSASSPRAAGAPSRAPGALRLPVVASKRAVEFFDETAYTCHGSTNRNFDARVFRLTYTSMTTPRQTYDLDLATGALTLLKETPVPNYDRAKYDSARAFARASDGTAVPMTLVWRRGALGVGGQALRPPPPRPVMLYGYGSYGACIDPWFDAKRLVLLDRGVIWCIAHVRGGGEMGRATWYEKEGKLLTKMNTFTDYIACAMHLTGQLPVTPRAPRPGKAAGASSDGRDFRGITSPDRLAIEGRSAGGLLMGAALNLRPDLFRACVAGVPFVDVINTMSDPGIPLTVTEWEEWGNPNEQESFAYMKRYSPYDNIGTSRSGGRLPALLVTAGLHDPRVAYWEPAKWVAKLRAHKEASGDDAHRVLLKTDLSSGHFSASDRYKYLREKAIEHAFVLRELGCLDGGDAPVWDRDFGLPKNKASSRL